MTSRSSTQRETEDGHATRAIVSDTGGAVFVEFLIAFLPVYVFFLCFIQLGMLFAVRLLTEHAAANSARAAAVVLGDDKKRYQGEKMHQMRDDPRRSPRFAAVRNAALLTMSPMIFQGMVQRVEIFFPPEDQPGGPEQSGTIKFAPMGEDEVMKVRVRVEVEAACRIGLANRIACPQQRILEWTPTMTVAAEAIYPYQGASYEY